MWPASATHAPGTRRGPRAPPPPPAAWPAAATPPSPAAAPAAANPGRARGQGLAPRPLHQRHQGRRRRVGTAALALPAPAGVQGLGVGLVPGRRWHLWHGWWGKGESSMHADSAERQCMGLTSGEESVAWPQPGLTSLSAHSVATSSEGGAVRCMRRVRPRSRSGSLRSTSLRRDSGPERDAAACRNKSVTLRHEPHQHATPRPVPSLAARESNAPLW